MSEKLEDEATSEYVGESEEKYYKRSHQLSATVNAAKEMLEKEDIVTAANIVNVLFDAHREYGGYEAKRFWLEDGGAAMPVGMWLNEVSSLFDPTIEPNLHGRQVVLGLSMLERNIGEQLLEDYFLGYLIDEIEKDDIKQSIESILTSRGRPLWDDIQNRLNPVTKAVAEGDIEEAKKDVTDKVPTYPDLPAEVDKLGREKFAEALTLRIRRIHNENNSSNHAGAFLMHIHGPWGSGKTSLLNFMEQYLKDPMKGKAEQDPTNDNAKISPTTDTGYDSSSWVVVKFNAWQHQNIGPPWWSLMDTVYRGASRQLQQMDWRRAAWLKAKEKVWRLSTGRLHYYLAFIFLLFASLLFFVWQILPGFLNGEASRMSFEDYAQIITIILTSLAAVWTGFLAVSRSLVPGSANAARSFMESGKDPLQQLTNHFNDLIKWTKQPVAIFIDDLDRCQSDYAVELLEGIQTLFKAAPVTYVVASDRRWLRISYEKMYDDFTGTVEEPGRPLGYLFLEKTFQISASMPRLSSESREQYWKHLIQMDKTEDVEQIEKVRKDANQRSQQLTTQEEFDAEIEASSDPIYKQTLREALIVWLAAPEMIKHTEHLLKSFAPFLEPNPRSMKRLVNAYDVQRDIAILRGGKVQREKLALWTIISLRWPLWAEHLLDYPEMINYIGKDIDEIPANLWEKSEKQGVQELFKDSAVREVIQGKKGDIDVGTSLDEKTIRNFAGLRTTDSKMGAVA